MVPEDGPKTEGQEERDDFTGLNPGETGCALFRALHCCLCRQQRAIIEGAALESILFVRYETPVIINMRGRVSSVLTTYFKEAAIQFEMNLIEKVQKTDDHFATVRLMTKARRLLLRISLFLYTPTIPSSPCGDGVFHCTGPGQLVLSVLWAQGWNLAAWIVPFSISVGVCYL
jgi:hypothetical protein